MHDKTPRFVHDDDSASALPCWPDCCRFRRRKVSHDRDLWEQHRNCFGWIGLRDIEHLVGNCEFFQHSRHFLKAKRGASTCSEASSCKEVRTQNWNKFNQHSATIQLRDRLRLVIENSGGVKDGRLRIARRMSATQRFIRRRLAPSQCLQYFRLPFVYRSG